MALREPTGFTACNSPRRGVYHGQDANTSVEQDDSDAMARGGRRSRRPRAVVDTSDPLASPITPLHCSAPGGRSVLLHHCDIVFMTYESLRKELAFQNRRAPGHRRASGVMGAPADNPRTACPFMQTTELSELALCGS